MTRVNGGAPPPHGLRGHNRLGILWTHYGLHGRAFCAECGRRLPRRWDRGYVAKRRWRNLDPVQRLWARVRTWWKGLTYDR